LREMPAMRIRFEYEIFNETEKLIHVGETVLVFVDKATGKPCRPPEVMRSLLEPFFK